MIGVDAKAFATLQARAALAGCTCHATEAGNFVLSRFSGGWVFDTIESAGAWLDHVAQPSPVIP